MNNNEESNDFAEGLADVIFTIIIICLAAWNFDISYHSGGFAFMYAIMPTGWFAAAGKVMFYRTTKVKFKWAFITNLVASFLNVIAISVVNPIISGVMFFLTIAILIIPGLMSPLLYSISRKSVLEKDKARAQIKKLQSYDSSVLNIAKNYGGIITKSVIVYELKLPLEIAEQTLERFINYDEAKKIKTKDILIYDFPSARIHLNRTDIKIIEVLRDHFKGMFRADLIRQTRLPIETLEESLKRLESIGIVYYNEIHDKYKLRGVSIK